MLRAGRSWRCRTKTRSTSSETVLDMAYSGDISLRSDRCLRYLRERFEETVSTAYVVEEERYVDFRFWRSPQERITVQVAENGSCDIRVTGPYERVLPLEEELLEAFADDIIAPTFGAVLSAVDFLERTIGNQWWTQLRHACLEQPTWPALEQLVSCHREQSLSHRARRESFPRGGGSFTLGGSAWGVTIRFRYVDTEDYGGWSIEAIG